MSVASERKRVTFRLDTDEYERLKYWASSRDMSVDEYVRYALDRVIAVDAGDIDVPNILVQRENQLIDLVTALSVDVENLQRVTVDSFSQLIGLTRGDNYLLEEESGEL